MGPKERLLVLRAKSRVTYPNDQHKHLIKLTSQESEEGLKK